MIVRSIDRAFRRPRQVPGDRIHGPPVHGAPASNDNDNINTTTTTTTTTSKSTTTTTTTTTPSTSIYTSTYNLSSSQA